VSQELTNLSKKQKKYTAQEKIGYLRKHLVEKEPVGKLCDEGTLSPTVFYRWQEKLFSEGAKLFERGEGLPEVRRTEQEKIERLEKKLQQKDEVLAELMAEYVALKKATGGL
jgi:transposase